MRTRLPFAAVLCLCTVAGAAVAAAAAPGGVTAIKPTLRVVADSTDVDHTDPALAYSVLGWQIEYETCRPLVGHSDRTGTTVKDAVSPVGAIGMPVVSNGGRTYVFTVRSGMKFSNGAPLTAANYEYAFDRDALRSLNSPVTALMSAVRGWDAENNSSTLQSVSGVTAQGNTLTIRLLRPDGPLLSILATPFFCPIEKAPPFYVGGKWVDTEVKGPYPGAGPYYLAARDVGSDIVLKRNRHYNGNRPRVSSTIRIDVKIGSTQAFDGIKDGTYASDLNGNPEPSQNQALAQQYGINKTRFRVEPTLIVSYLAMNVTRPIFASVSARKGFNYAINRPALSSIAGNISASPTVQILPRQLTGGIWSTTLYPTSSPDQARFDEAATMSNNCGAGHTGALYFWHGNSAPALAAAAIVKHDLQEMGCGNVVDVYPCSRFHCDPPPPMDIIATSWSDDYPDAYDFLGPLLDGRNQTYSPNEYSNLDHAHFTNATFNQKLDQANALTGIARNRAFGRLDQWVMTNYAPLAPIADPNFVDYLSPNAHGYVYNGPLGAADLGDLYQS
jgi:peptide/nickel transport system substrate-binding protein